MLSLNHQQWDRYFELAARLETLSADRRRAELKALHADGADRDLAALLSLHFGLAPEFDRCRSGERIRNFLLAEPIGCGGMGAVYRATQTFADGIERNVAVKLINPALILREPDDSRRRFQREIATLVKLEHKGIARIYDGGLHRCDERGEETLYLAMELVDGKTLAAYVAEHRAELGTGGILRLFVRVCDAVAYAHRQGILHRDLKPANVLVDANGDPRVIDFGLAETLGVAAHDESAGILCGTPAYMSPEQLGDEPVAPTPANDVYALGVILHELLTGRPRTRQGSDSTQSDDLAILREVDGGAAVAQIIARAVAGEVGERYASVEAFSNELAQRLKVLQNSTQTLLRTRRSLIAKVQEFWIDGVFSNSLHAASLIELSLALQLDAVEQPWDLIMQAPRQRLAGAPQGTPIVDVFDASGEGLLIMGAPGAGKTTLLLALATALLERARESEAQRVPVIFHLSTWADQRLSVDDWLVDELDKRYDVPPSAGRECLAGSHLAVLLDGLDEVAPAHRVRCVAAINDYRRRHADSSIAVCSRLADCEALPLRLRLPKAVVIQALTLGQTDDYLAGIGGAAEDLRTALREDEDLRELLTTPLLLSIAALVYRESPPPVRAALQSSLGRVDRRAQLFAAYTEAMFARRGVVTSYTPERAMHWLSWLANALLQNHQSVLYVEWMQPSWLPRSVGRWAAGAGSVVLCGLLVGLVVGFGGGMVGDLAYSLPLSLLFGVGGGIAFGLAGLGDEIRPVTRLRWSWLVLRRAMVTNLARAASVGALLFAGVALVFDSSLGLTVGLTAVLAFCYFGGLEREQTPSDGSRMTTPNQGMRDSLRNAWRGAIAGALAGAVAGGLTAGLLGTFFCAVLFSLITALIAGAHPCLQHLILRWLLWKGGCVPWSLVRFLEFGVERIFLHRVGGGYAFVHRAVLEYFAGLPSGRPRPVSLASERGTVGTRWREPNSLSS